MKHTTILTNCPDMTIRNPLTARRAEILQIVLGTEGGVCARDLADRLGINTQSASEHLRKLRALGFIGPVSNGGPGTKWTTAHTAEQLREITAAERARVRERERRATLAQRWEAGPTQRIVAASQCQPLHGCAPASVFNLAA